ncbi:Transcriptional regulatory protein [Wickerhamomyces ciferrii]|uniref:Transcriptional regulatory protein n=1 Tax=Wickerhamomyces ciferrii (strain ATCC 14091 / BCRC 22168 / CBS 111 / JCM 3599 / NBRC 0793 / NRRL Y-1031 F-60-10) TaxID=1206466 RepID=K0KRU8_WICCF|nr:Transcriptional regulatory protein [Wickerhamomyces ciferrii]CCH44054.1 Transcriptional regulatory protein [Wickerhamomyces ciferrii]
MTANLLNSGESSENNNHNHNNNNNNANNPTAPVPPKSKRSRDGCQNCKEGRIKCDKSKPICKVCLRKGLTCDYSKKLMWISVEKSDSRHPSFKNKRTNSKSNTPKDQSIDGIKQSKSITPENIPQQQIIDADEELDMLDTSEEYQLLSPSDQVIQYNKSRNSSLSSVQSYYNEDGEIDELSDEFQESVQLDLDTISHHGLMKLDHQRILETQRNFSMTYQTFPREIFNIFQSKDTQNIFSHYLFVTCIAIDPLNGAGPQNISEKFFVPVAVNDPATLHGILSISASQLSFSNPEYKRLSLLHKSLSYKHLYALLKDEKESVSLNALSAIICHLSIEIIQSGLQNWPFHIKALRKIVQERKKRKIKEDQLTWFLYLRIARYDNFATLTTGEKPLFKEFNSSDFKTLDPLIQNFDCVFGCPTTVLFFCSELTYIGKTIFDSKQTGNFVSLSNHLESIGYSEIILKKRLNKLLKRSKSPINSSDWDEIEKMWSSTMIILFHQSLYNNVDKEILNQEKITFFNALQEFVKFDSFFCSNLLWPLLKISTGLNSNNDRIFVKDTLQLFFDKTNIGAFKGVLKIVDELWELMDNGKYNEPYDWWRYQDEKCWNIFLA